jgi:hypothetical protein
MYKTSKSSPEVASSSEIWFECATNIKNEGVIEVDQLPDNVEFS